MLYQLSYTPTRLSDPVSPAFFRFASPGLSAVGPPLAV